MEQQELREIERRPLRYWNVDGLPELWMGVLWLMTGGLWLVGSSLPKGLFHSAFWIMTGIVVPVAALACQWALLKLKERLTYPRAGYVCERQPGLLAWFGLAAVILAMVAFILAAFGSSDSKRLMPLIFGIAIAGGFIVSIRRLRATWLNWFALAPLSLGAYSYWRELGVVGFDWLFIVIGTVCTISGALRLRRFLRENPKAVETEA